MTDEMTRSAADTTVTRSPAVRVDAALLVLRVGLGIVMIAHGLQKFAGGLDGIAGFFGSLGIPAPELAAPFVATLEVVGGAAVLVGVLTRVFAALLAITLVVAIFTAHLSAGFYAADGGFELPMLAAFGMVALVIAGPGRYSVLGGLERVPAWAR